MAIKRKLTLVVGAGASSELGLPVGRELLSDISELVSVSTTSFDDERFERNIRCKIVNEELRDALQRLAGSEGRPVTIRDFQRVEAEALWISKNCSLAPSIDNLLHTHSSDSRIVDIGKLMICAALKAAEKSSCLCPKDGRSDDYSFLYSSHFARGRKVSGADSWLGQLFWLIAEGNTFADFLTTLEQISFISFNYDRCIEHYLIHAAVSYFRIKELKQVERIQSAIKIVFPYGNLGDLVISDQGASGFGSFDIWSAAQQIRTFTQGMLDKEVQNQISQSVSECEELIFLGFGFIDLNLNAVFESSNQNIMNRVSGTAYAFSNANVYSVKFKLANLVQNSRQQNLGHFSPEKIHLEDLGCRDFFAANSIRLRN